MLFSNSTLSDWYRPWHLIACFVEYRLIAMKPLGKALESLTMCFHMEGATVEQFAKLIIYGKSSSSGFSIKWKCQCEPTFCQALLPLILISHTIADHRFPHPKLVTSTIAGTKQLEVCFDNSKDMVQHACCFINPFFWLLRYLWQNRFYSRIIVIKCTETIRRHV